MIRRPEKALGEDTERGVVRREYEDMGTEHVEMSWEAVGYERWGGAGWRQENATGLSPVGLLCSSL